MKAKHRIRIEKDMESQRVRVCIGAGPNRIVDGFIEEDERQELDDILNSLLEYQEKIDAIKELVSKSGTYEEATHGRAT